LCVHVALYPEAGSFVVADFSPTERPAGFDPWGGSTWDIGNYSGTEFSFDNGNRKVIVTQTGGGRIPSTTSKSTGKRAFKISFHNESTPVSWDYDINVGLSNGDYSLDGGPGEDANSVGAWLDVSGGGIYYDNAQVGAGDYAAIGVQDFDVDFRVDFNTRKWWYKVTPGITGFWNGDADADPEIGVGGFDLFFDGPAFVYLYLYGCSATINFDPAIESSFTSWDEVIVAASLAQNVIATVPTGYKIGDLIIRETAGMAVTGGIKIGTTDGGADIAASIDVGANSFIRTPALDLVDAGPFAGDPQQIYIQAVTDWGGANVEIVIGLEAV